MTQSAPQHSDNCQLLLGDCLGILRSISTNSVDSIITDPPYGMDFQSSWTEKSKRKPKIANDARPFIWWLYDAFRVLKDGGTLVCFCEWKHQELWRQAIECAGFAIKSHIIWDRQWHGMGDLAGSFAPQHDIIWFATKGRFTFPTNRPKSVLSFKRIGGEAAVHPTEKPVDLMKELVTAVTPPGGTVLDPFLGSGTTAVAALQLGRSFIGIEISEEYLEIARRRISNQN